jgi:hypothetical protein
VATFALTTDCRFRLRLSRKCVDRTLSQSGGRRAAGSPLHRAVIPPKPASWLPWTWVVPSQIDAPDP